MKIIFPNGDKLNIETDCLEFSIETWIEFYWRDKGLLLSCFCDNYTVNDDTIAMHDCDIDTMDERILAEIQEPMSFEEALDD